MYTLPRCAILIDRSRLFEDRAARAGLSETLQDANSIIFDSQPAKRKTDSKNNLILVYKWGSVAGVRRTPKHGSQKINERLAVRNLIPVRPRRLLGKTENLWQPGTGINLKEGRAHAEINVLSIRRARRNIEWASCLFLSNLCMINISDALFSTLLVLAIMRVTNFCLGSGNYKGVFPVGVRVFAGDYRGLL